MKRKLTQEHLKLIACITMLIDHFAAVLLLELLPMTQGTVDLYYILRIIGRFAFPIYCFLMAEGAHYTRSPKKYALRLAVGAVLSELPYDLAFYGGWTLEHQSVMVTLLLGFGALEAMKRCPKLWQKLLVLLPFALLADWMHTDYGTKGVLLVAMFALTRDMSYKRILQFFGMWFLFSPNHIMFLNWLGGISWTIQEHAVLAILPIALYSGEKRSTSRALQWAFYLFYPVHLTVLYGGLFLMG